MPQAKVYTFEEIFDMLPTGERDHLEVLGEDKQWIAIRKIATDYAGTYVKRAFKKVNEHYAEIDVKTAVEEMASFLGDHVKMKTVLKELLVNLNAYSFIDLYERIQKKPKVTLGIQKGSCVNLYVRGKQGVPAALQLTP